MADFSQFGGISDDWTAYVTAHPHPPLPPDLTPVQLQERTNAGREANSREILSKITSKCQIHEWNGGFKTHSSVVDIDTRDFTCPTSNEETIPLRVYKPASTPTAAKLPLFIFYHGGGYCFGSLSSEDGFCSWIVEKLGIVVINVCYRHTPQWKWPAQREDAYNSLNWVFGNMKEIGGDSNQVFVGGRSSGSNLAAGITLRETETVRFMIAFSVFTYRERVREESKVWFLIYRMYAIPMLFLYNWSRIGKTRSLKMLMLQSSLRAGSSSSTICSMSKIQGRNTTVSYCHLKLTWQISLQHIFLSPDETLFGMRLCCSRRNWGAWGEYSDLSLKSASISDIVTESRPASTYIQEYPMASGDMGNWNLVSYMTRTLSRHSHGS